MTTTRKSPKVYLVTLADAHKIGERRKVDLFGVFGALGVWGVPTKRECSIAIGITDLMPGRTSLAIWLRRRGKRAVRLGTAELNIQRESGLSELLPFAVLANRIPLPIEDFGNFEIGVGFGETARGGHVYWCPLAIYELPWPELPTGTVLERVLRRPEALKGVRARVICDKCKEQYTFQKNLDPNAPLDPGAEPFPLNGVLVCKSCKAKHYMRDIEGQTLAQLVQSAIGTGT